MNASSDSDSDNAGGRWTTRPRSGLERLISPWEYRHLRFFGAARVFGGTVAAGAGVVCLAYRAYGWAALFGAIGAANIGGGYWYLTIDRSHLDQT